MHRLDPALPAALRLGLFQLLFLDGVPDHAAVAESVELAKSEGERRGHRLVNAVLRRADRERPGRPATRRPPTRRSTTRSRAGSSTPGGSSSAPRRRARCSPPTNGPAELALRVNTLVTDPSARERAPRGRRELPTRPSSSTARSTPTAIPAVRRGRLPAAVARLDARRARARPPAGRAHPRPVRRAGREDHPHRGARMGDRGRSSPSSATPAGRERSRRPCARLRARSSGDDGRRRAAELPREFDRVLVDPPCSGLGTLQVAPRPALAHDPGARRGALAPRSHPRARPGALRPGGTLVYSICTLTRENEDGSPIAGAVERTLPHRDGTEGFTIAARWRSDLGPICPGCGEPWLRPTNLPGRYRCVNCLHRFELRSVCPSAGSTRRSCACPTPRSCAASTATPRCCDHMSAVRVAPSILSADFARLGEQVAPSCTRGRGHPRRRHGRPLRPADHDGPDRGRRLRDASRSSSTATS